MEDYISIILTFHINAATLEGNVHKTHVVLSFSVVIHDTGAESAEHQVGWADCFYTGDGASSIGTLVSVLGVFLALHANGSEACAVASCLRVENYIKVFLDKLRDHHVTSLWTFMSTPVKPLAHFGAHEVNHFPFLPTELVNREDEPLL